MKILTLNTHSWLEDNQMEKLEQIVSKIIEEDYDVIALQEVNQVKDNRQVASDFFCPPQSDELNVPLKKENFAKLVAEELQEKGRTYYFTWSASHIGYDVYDEGLAILSKEKPAAKSKRVSEEVDYQHFTRRIALIAEIEIGGVAYSIVNVHLSWWELDGKLYFKNEWNKVASLIEGKSNVIVVGDFNNAASTIAEGYDYIRKITPQLRDSFKVADNVYGEVTAEGEIDGWAGSKVGKRIDFIFTDQSLNPITHKVAFDGKNGPIVSDHYGVEIAI